MSEQSEQEYPKGFTLSIYMPPEASAAEIQLLQDRVSKLVYGELFQDRGSWDPFIVGHGGDILQVDKDCECCPPHLYFSTSCFHGNHTYCQQETGLIGTKVPARCKFCEAPCLCSCHPQMHNKKHGNEKTV